MRIDPIYKSKGNFERVEKIKRNTRKITRAVAIGLAAATTFGLFIKILFF